MSYNRPKVVTQPLTDVLPYMQSSYHMPYDVEYLTKEYGPPGHAYHRMTANIDPPLRS